MFQHPRIKLALSMASLICQTNRGHTPNVLDERSKSSGIIYTDIILEPPNPVCPPTLYTDRTYPVATVALEDRWFRVMCEYAKGG